MKSQQAQRHREQVGSETGELQSHFQVRKETGITIEPCFSKSSELSTSIEDLRLIEGICPAVDTPTRAHCKYKASGITKRVVQCDRAIKAREPISLTYRLHGTSGKAGVRSASRYHGVVASGAFQFELQPGKAVVAFKDIVGQCFRVVEHIAVLSFRRLQLDALIRRPNL